MIFQLLGGIVVAGGVFAAFLWSVYQGALAKGPLRWAHIAAAVCSILGMVTLSMVSPFLAFIVGIALGIAAGAATVLESGWNRLLTLFQLAFAIILIIGLPFNG